MAIPNQAPGIVGEGVETGWRASLVDEGTVRLSSKGESNRITQRSAVQIRPTQPRINAQISGHSNPRRRSLTLIRIDFAIEQSVPVGGEDQDGIVGFASDYST